MIILFSFLQRTKPIIFRLVDWQSKSTLFTIFKVNTAQISKWININKRTRWWDYLQFTIKQPTCCWEIACPTETYIQMKRNSNSYIGVTTSKLIARQLKFWDIIHCSNMSFTLNSSCTLKWHKVYLLPYNTYDWMLVV